VIFPLSLLRNMNALRHASGIAICAFLYMTGFVFLYFFVEGKTNHNVILVNTDWQVARAIPIVVYAYSCHSQCLPVYGELKERTASYMRNVVWGGTALSFALYATVGLFGYLSFGEDVKGNVLLNYDSGNAFALIGRIMICCAIMFGYPMSSWVIRNSFEQIYFYLKEKYNPYNQIEDDSGKPLRKVTHLQNFIEIFVILSISVLLAIVIPNITTIFGVVGSTGSVTINFIVPGVMYLKICKKYLQRDQGDNIY